MLFRIASYAGSSLILWVVIRVHDQSPPDPALLWRVRVMILRGQNMPLRNSDLTMATHTPIDASVRS